MSNHSARWFILFIRDYDEVKDRVIFKHFEMLLSDSTVECINNNRFGHCSISSDMPRPDRLCSIEPKSDLCKSQIRMDFGVNEFTHIWCCCRGWKLSRDFHIACTIFDDQFRQFWLIGKVSSKQLTNWKIRNWMKFSSWRVCGDYSGIDWIGIIAWETWIPEFRSLQCDRKYNYFVVVVGLLSKFNCVALRFN